MEEVLKILSLGLISSLKFAASPFAALGYDFNYLQTTLITTAGGIIGVLFFFYFSRWISGIVTAYKNTMFFLFGINKNKSTEGILIEKKKIFTWKNKFIVLTVRKFGLIGIAMLTPTLLSIPLGTIIAARYFRNPKKVLVYLCTSVVLWSVILSSVVVIF